MKKRNLEMLLMFLAAFLFASCSSDNDDENGKGKPTEVTLSLTPDDGQFSADNATFTLKIETTGDWEATSDQSWCSISKQQGSGNILINGTIESNNTTDARVAVITIKVDGTEKAVTINQLGKGAQSISINLINPTDGNIQANGGNFSIGITTDGSWTAKSSQTWGTLSTTSGTGNATITGEITANTDKQDRTVVITIASKGGSSKSITLTQKGKNEGSTDPDPAGRPKGYAGRVEIPTLKGGSLNLFNTHTVNHNGNSKFINYSYEYDCEKRHPRWVAYVIDNVRNQNKVKRTDKWGNDSFIPSQYQTSHADYKGRYNRGHMVASGDRTYCYDANVQTFLYSNMSPQIVEFNGGIWEKMESRVRSFASSLSAQDTVYVVKGGDIDGKLIGYTNANHAAIPTHYYMALLKLVSGKYEAMAFWIDQENHSSSSLGTYAITVSQLEQNTGIEFFPNLKYVTTSENAKQIKSTFNKGYWGL